MPIYDLYSKRKQRTERADAPEVFQYDDLPKPLKTQLRQIFTAAIGKYYQSSGYGGTSPPNNNDAWKGMARILRRELGVDVLARGQTPYDEIMTYFESANTDDALSVVELCCRWIDTVIAKRSGYSLQTLGISQGPTEAIEEINYRFREAGVGYEFTNGEVIRIDSQFVHAEVVKPALTVLSDPRFKGAQDEFLEAHRQYRSGNNKDAVTGANRAFESTMKAICDIKGWPYDAKARASDLIKILRSNKLFPDYLDGSFDQLVATLSSGLPQVRNNAGGHGQGATPRETPSFVAAFALHLAATNIVFLTDAALRDAKVGDA